MATIQELVYRFTADTASIDAALRRLNGSVTNTGQTMSASLAGIGLALTAAITLPTLALAKIGLDKLMEFDQAKAGLKAVMNNAELAAKEIENLKRVAKSPGLGFVEAIKASTALQASMKLTAKESSTIIKEFANGIAATGGKEQFAGALKQIGQMISKNRILQEDFGIIQENMPRVNQAMMEAFGDTNIEKIRATGISAKDMIMKMVEAMSKWDRVSGGMRNTIDNFHDGIDELTKGFAKFLLPAVNRFITKLNDLIDKVNELPKPAKKMMLALTIDMAILGPFLLFSSILPSIVTGLTRVAIVSLQLTVAFGNLSVVIMQVALDYIRGTGAQNIYFGNMRAKLVGLASQLKFFTRTSWSVTKALGTMAQTFIIRNPYVAVIAAIIALLALIVRFRKELGIKKEIESLWNGMVQGFNVVKGIFKSIWGFFKDILTGLKQSFKDVMKSFESLWKPFEAMFGKFDDFLKKVGYNMAKAFTIAIFAPVIAIFAVLVGALSAIAGVIYVVNAAIAKMVELLQSAVNWFMRLIGLQNLFANQKRRRMTVIEILSMVAIAALRNQEIAITRNFARWERYYSGMKDIANGHIKIINDEIAAEREKQLAQVGFTGLRNMWQRGMESGAKEIFSMRGTSMDRTKEIRLLEQIAAYNKEMSDIAKANKEQHKINVHNANDAFNAGLVRFGI